jgi:acyl-CoA thioesterase I
MIVTRLRKTSLVAVVVTLLILITAALTITYFSFNKNFAFGNEPPIMSPNVVELNMRKGEALRVSFVGDSIDAGYYASDESLGFHGLVVGEWRKSGPVADYPMNHMIGGTAGDALRNPTYPKDQQLYVVELGTNDAPRVNYRELRTQYDTLLDRIRASSPDAALVCVGLWRPKKNADTFDTIIKDLCEVRGGVFVRISDLAANDSLKGPAGVPAFGGLSDSFHPNDLGHKLIADRILDVVRLNREG